MNAGIRSIVVIGALLLFLSLKLLSWLRLDHRLLLRVAGGRQIATPRFAEGLKRLDTDRL
jgi:hypothetical protein